MSLPAPGKVPVSVLVPTLNEEVNLPACLASLAWADEVFVVDSFSTDRTLDIARAYGAHVVQHPFENYSKQKNWALDTLPFRHDWLLIVDADERVTPELRDEITGIVLEAELDNPPAPLGDGGSSTPPAPPAGERGLGGERENTLHLEMENSPSPEGRGGGGVRDRPLGYYINRKFIFMGAWIQHAGWYPSWNLRLFRHRLGRYDNREVHEHIVLDGPAGYLKHNLLHEDQRGLEAFIARHNRYSTLEAAARFKAATGSAERARLPARFFGGPVERKRFLRERVWPRIPAKPLALFLYMYVLRQGFRDGRAGFAFCVFHAFQEFTVGLKLSELRRLNSTTRFRPPFR